MDAAVGGAFLSAFLQVLFDRMASSEFLNLFKNQNLDKELLEKLETTLISVNGLLDDAEEKQITKPKPAVREWLDRLKDAVYVADDCLDEIAYEALRSEEDGFKTNIDQVRSSLSSISPFKKNEIEAKLEKILERFEYLVSQKNALGLTTREGVGKKPSSQKIPTTSLPSEPQIYGRDVDKEAIIKLLVDDGNGNEPGPVVIPIAGMGGIGKTTLAQLVYNGSSGFDPKAWVYVSEEFDVFNVTKDILKAVDKNICFDARTPDQLQVELEERLKGKRFLLVLDDVWSYKYNEWDILLRPLKDGLKGSKIIVTTRNETVARVMGSSRIHRLKKLSEDDCWSLFVKHAFHNGNFEPYPHLQAIGRQIVKKCDGLPLAAKLLGGLLRSKRKVVEEWEHVLNSNLWDLSEDDVLPALRLSYCYLPSQLKQCFAYCAIFSKGHYFRKQELVPFWMAEGFLIPSRGQGHEMEELGDMYFHELISRFFFEPTEDESYFIMHDLIHDLAKSVSGEFCFMLGGENSCKISERTRHLSYKELKIVPNHFNDENFKMICRAPYLRTFVAADGRKKSREINVEGMDEFLSKLQHLRVLTLTYNDMVELPDSIENLNHLRYLDLSWSLNIQRLPDSITTLYNLQTLILLACRNLVELPANFSRLINLSHLDVSVSKLQEMPPRMGMLKKLKILADFIVGKHRGSSIKELGKIQEIRELGISNLQNIVDAQNASEANLKSKRHLRRLRLKWDANSEADDSELERSILEQLEPHTKVEDISITGYRGTKYPAWLGDSSFSNMVSLQLEGFKYCSSLPPFGQLVSLKELKIENFELVVVVGSEFYGNNTEKPFQSLEFLCFVDLPQWREWTPCVGAFPRLQELHLYECPMLEIVPPLQNLGPWGRKPDYEYWDGPKFE